MKNKLNLLLVVFAAHCVAVGYSAEPSAQPTLSALPTQPPEMVFQTLAAKLEQAREVLSEIRDLLKQEEKILAGTRAQKEQAKKAETALAEHERAAEVIRQEIKKLRGQLKEAEKELAAQAKQAERYRRLQAEYAKAQKERLDSETKVQHSEDRLASAQKSLEEIKAKSAETMKQVNEAKGRERDLKNAASLLKAERARRAEALTRAERAVEKAEKAEKKRLLLASRLAELEQSLPVLKQDLPDLAGIEGEIENEKKAIAEAEEKIKKEEKARRTAEKEIAELTEELKENEEIIRTGGRKKEAMRRQSQLGKIRKERSEIESRLQQLEARRTENEKSIASLTDNLENIKKADEEKSSAERTELENEIESEKKTLTATEQKINNEERKIKDAQSALTALKEQLKQAQKTARLSAEKEGDQGRLHSLLAQIRKQRRQAEVDFKQVAEKLRESEKSAAALTNALAIARIQAESNIVSERMQAESDLENEKKALRELGEKISKDEKARAEAEKNVAELKKQLKVLQKSARGGEKEGNLQRLLSRLESARRERTAAEDELKKTEGKIKESEESAALLANMIAEAAQQQERDRETAKAIEVLTDELEKETALMNEVTERFDRQNRDFKALEDEKNRLTQHLVLVREKLGREELNVNKLDEIGFQIAGRKKTRADMETGLEFLTRNQGALAKENKQLNQALIDAGKEILKNERDLRRAARLADELQKEEKKARKSEALLREKEESLKQLGAEKADLQKRLNDTLSELVSQEERLKDLAEKRRALDEEKKIKSASEKKYRELAKTEKEYKKQTEKLKGQLSAAAQRAMADKSAATRKSESLSSQAEKMLIASRARTGATRDAEDMTESSLKDALSVEQDILSKARLSSIQPSGQDTGADQEKKSVKHPARGLRQNRQAQAEEHYALGIQKWDENDLNGAIAEFKEVIRLNPDAAGAYYNISLTCLRLGRKEEACDYAYLAGECYLRINNSAQAARMALLLTKIDQNSPLIPKLRSKLAAASQ